MAGAKSTNSTVRGQRLNSLVAFRGLIAVLVMMHHYSMYALASRWSDSAFGGVFDFGYGRVSFFLVSSGFLIGHIHTRDFGHSDRLFGFVVRRARSIYPLYWIVIALILLLGLLPLGYATGKYPSPATILGSLALVAPTNEPMKLVLNVSWTLFHEMAFYVAVGVAIISARLGVLLVAAWGAVIAAALFGYSIDWLPDYIASPLNLSFLFGFAASRVVAIRQLPWPWLLLAGAAVAGVAVNLVYRSAEPPLMVPRLLVGVAWAVAIAALAAIEQRRPIAVPAPLLRLGEASYAIYLIHFPAVMVLGKLATRSGLSNAMPAEMVVASIAATALASAFVLHRLVERPVVSWLRDVVPTGSARTPVPAE